MAKTTIVNLDELVNNSIEDIVTSNVNIVAANQAIADAEAAAAIAASKAAEADAYKVDVETAVAEAELKRVAAENAASLAAIKADEANASATEAQLAELGALDARNTAEAYRDNCLNYLAAMNIKYDQFDDRWLGALGSNPITDNDGHTLREGALFWHMTEKAVKIWTGLIWTPLKDANGSLVTELNLADLSDKMEARTNLDVYSKAETHAVTIAEIDAKKGLPNELATLDANGLVPTNQLPSYVDDVLEVATYADLPAIGETGKIYVVVADETSGNDTSSYRWTGAVYAMVSNTLTATDVKGLYESNLDTNVYTDAEKTKVGYISVTQEVDLDTIESGISLNNIHRTSDGSDHTFIDQDVTTTSNPTFNSLTITTTVDGRDLSVDGAKLDTIEEGATADQTAEEIEALYEGLTNTNKYTDAEKTKVGYITVTQSVNLDTVESDTELNNTHRTSDGTDHTYIDQDVTTTATPTFAGVQFSGGAGSAGTVTWNADEETLDVVVDGTVLQIGQEFLVNVRNDTGSTIENGKPVMLTGTLGTSSRLLVAEFDPANPLGVTALVGLTTEDIDAGQDGKVTMFGKVRNVDTTGTLYGETWADGDVLYIDPTVVGGLTKVVPANSEIKVPVAAIIHTGAANGSMMVRVTAVNYNAYAVASSIEVSPQGNLSSTTVQSAIEELQSDIDGMLVDKEW